MEVYLSLIIPAYNEASRRLRENLNEILLFLRAQQYAWELIVVDDGSSDGTAEAAAAVASSTGERISVLRNETNRGKGYSVRRGVLAAAGQKVFFTDADLSTPIEEVNRCLPHLDKADIMIGSRALPESDITVRQPPLREFAGRVFNVFARLIAVKGFMDTQCGFKGFNRAAAQDIFARQRLPGYGFDVEVLYVANKLGYKIVEVPISWRDREASRLSAFHDGVKLLRDLAQVRVNDLKGLYEKRSRT